MKGPAAGEVGRMVGHAVVLSLYVTSVGAVTILPDPVLEVTASGFIFDLGLPGNAVGPHQELAAVAGPLAVSVTAQANFTGWNPDDLDQKALVFSAGTATADYGTNRAAVKNGVAAGTGDEPIAQLVGNLGVGSSSNVNALAQSSWRDTFTILGGSGTGTAIISVKLSGTVQTRYGENGNFYLDSNGSPTVFEAFGRGGGGSVSYSLDPLYVEPPIDFGEDGPNKVVLFQEDSNDPPDFVVTTGGVPFIVLTGELIFEYGVEFALHSQLAVSGFNQIDVDYGHTAELSLFDLPAGATLISGSGHVYQTAVVPTPESFALMLSTLGALAVWGWRQAWIPGNSPRAHRSRGSRTRVHRWPRPRQLRPARSTT